MKKIPEDVIHFFRDQGFVVISTVGKDGSVHNACKGIVMIQEEGEVYLLDLYSGNTYVNLKANPNISITSVDEHRFRGYCLKGKAKIVSRQELGVPIIKAWEDKLTQRITQRLIKNLKGEQGHPKHPEALLPSPEYLIVVKVSDIIDLTPRHLK